MKPTKQKATHKYTTEERQKALKIYNVKNKMNYHRQEWLRCESILNSLISSLNGKYSGKQ